MSSRRKNRSSLGAPMQSLDIEAAIVESSAPAPAVAPISIPQSSSTINPVPSSNAAPPSPAVEDDLNNEQQSMKKKRGSRNSGKFKPMVIEETPVVPIANKPPSPVPVEEQAAAAPPQASANMNNDDEFSQLDAKSASASNSNKKKGGRNSGKFGAQKIDDNRLPSPAADAPSVQESTPKRNSGKFASVESTPEQQSQRPSTPDADNDSTPARNARSAKPPITPKNQSTPKQQHNTPKSSPAQQQQASPAPQQPQQNEEVEGLKKKVESLQSQLTKAEQEHTRLQNIIASHSQHEQHANELKKRLQHAEKDRDHYMALSESTRSDFEKELARANKLDADLKLLLKKNDDLRADVAKLEQREAHLNGSLVNAHSEKDKLVEQVKREGEKYKILEVQVQRLQEANDSLEALKKQHVKTIEDLNLKNSQLEASNSQKIQAEQAKSAEALVRAQAQAEEAKKTIETKYQGQINGLQAEYSAEKQKSENEVKKLREKFAAEQETCNKLKLTIADREKESKDAKKQISAEFEKQIADLKAKIEKLEKANNNNAAQVQANASAASEVAAVQKEKATLLNTIQHLNSDNEDLKKRIKELEDIVKQKSREVLVKLAKETAMKISMEGSNSRDSSPAKNSFANVALAAMDKNNKEKQQVPKHNASSVLGSYRASGLAVAALMAMNKTLADN